MKPEDNFQDGIPQPWFIHAKLNEFCDRQYGFNLDTQTDLDSVDVGSIMRFANHAKSYSTYFDATGGSSSSYPYEMANCDTRIQFNGYEQACFLQAKRDIAANEELLFDYNYEQMFNWLECYNKRFMILE